MRRVRFRTKADSGLMSIRRSTIERWGREKAEDYVRSIAAAVERVASGRGRGRRAIDVAPDLWRIRVGSHGVYYRVAERYLDVLRILHERMDPARHLL
ncbi:type II toxin-antitoxin system RelE/ParE family toxin [Salinarimonas sp.]|uniref:type II toxin-antitoxin system RelE/ParE family toxin n=1 Tax=Salinarimonas sp. TaxID=2766526 RepID=UPI0032D938AE